MALICIKNSAIFEAQKGVEIIRQMYKVFVNNKLVIFDNYNTNLKHQNVIEFENIRDMMERIIAFESNNKLELLVRSKNIEEVWQKFKNQYLIIEAAGGIVTNKKNETLLIFRNGKWDLPKGKREVNETIEQAARREVIEECGLQQLKLGKRALITYHTYFFREKRVLKPTYWYFMESSEKEDLLPQLEEGITQVKWFKKSEMSAVFTNTYNSIKEVLACV